MRVPIRLKILVLVAVPLVALSLAGLWIVHSVLTERVDRTLREDLRRTASLLEAGFEARARAQSGEARVVARDPRFIAVLSIPAPPTDAAFIRTVREVAAEFARAAGSDVFEVIDGQGRRLVSAGRHRLNDATLRLFSMTAIAGRPIGGVVPDGGVHCQLSASAVRAQGRVVGAIVVGTRIDGAAVARQSRLTQSEVTFFDGDRPAATTLPPGPRREALLAALAAAPAGGLDREPFRVLPPGGGDLALRRGVPGAGSEQTYVLQRSLEAETAAMREIQRWLVRLALLALVAALAAGLLIAAGILRPVARLVRAAEAMERGDYEAPLDTRGRDEIGFLARRFHDMRQRHRAHVANLREVARVRSEFIDVAAHELRTPISIVKGYHELMQQGALGPLTPGQRDGLEAIGRAVAKLASIAEDATRMAQLEESELALQLDGHGVAGLLREAVTAARTAGSGRRVEVTMSSELDLPPARVDGARMVVALTHLLTNGIRFTPDGGRVAIEARRDGGVLEIVVADNGMGLSEEMRRRLLDRLPTSRESIHHHSAASLEYGSQGLGMGLTIARGIIEAHGGTLDLGGAEGRGATVTVRLPAFGEPLADAA